MTPTPVTATDDSGSNNGEPPANFSAYSVFTKGERRMMVILIGLAMLFSPLTANIYFPAMSKLEADLGTSAQLINLTITSYLVFQAVAPALFGDLADAVGRRPAFLGMFALYSVANLGLALQHSFPALLTLRMVQSLGASATVAVSYGLVADIVTAAERGGVIGASMVATNLGPVFAPLLGGAILGCSGSWQWIFWCLLLCGTTMLALMLFLLPETARGIVGNGSIRPRAWRRPLLSVLVPSIPIPRHGKCASSSLGVDETPVAESRKLARIPNPLRSVRIIFYKDSALILLITGVFYTIYYCLQASIALLFRDKYPQFSDATIGACYLSIGCGVVVGGYLNGRLMNRNYALTAAEMGQEVVDKNNNDLSKFPIERARLRSMISLQLLHLGPLVAYGWLMQNGVHVSGPLIIHFILGFLETCIVQDKPSAAAASGNIIRCGLSAAGISAMEPLMQRMGLGWYFTFLSVLGAVVGLVSCEALKRNGMGWRLARHDLPSGRAGQES